jgi:hypothetical protein
MSVPIFGAAGVCGVLMVFRQLLRQCVLMLSDAGDLADKSLQSARSLLQ